METQKLNIVEAINLALKQEMERDPSVIIFGEDVGKDGGVFRVTDKLQDQFGEERVFDSPLGESGIAGMAIGLSIYGFKPVVEVQFDGFYMQMFDQMIQNAARMRNRSRGRYTCPFVVRVPSGGGIKALEHHSESIETYVAHTPGLKVVYPSTPYDAKGLLLAAIRDPDPVIFMEPKRLYRAIKQEVPLEDYIIPIGQANVLQEGTDLTIIAWGAMVREAQKAIADTQANPATAQLSIELIDLRTISPMDEATILASVNKTGRLIIVQEANKTFGPGAEIAALVAEKALYSLKCPIQRVAAPDVTVPYLKAENWYLPDAFQIQQAIAAAMI
ncbi:MAG: alpha-ketoacid dehydrogenase subunit beta [Candidatus Gracilibacteria bacterium]